MQTFTVQTDVVKVKRKCKKSVSNLPFQKQNSQQDLLTQNHLPLQEKQDQDKKESAWILQLKKKKEDNITEKVTVSQAAEAPGFNFSAPTKPRRVLLDSEKQQQNHANMFKTKKHAVMIVSEQLDSEEQFDSYSKGCNNNNNHLPQLAEQNKDFLTARSIHNTHQLSNQQSFSKNLAQSNELGRKTSSTPQLGAYVSQSIKDTKKFGGSSNENKNIIPFIIGSEMSNNSNKNRYVKQDKIFKSQQSQPPFQYIQTDHSQLVTDSNSESLCQYLKAQDQNYDSQILNVNTRQVVTDNQSQAGNQSHSRTQTRQSSARNHHQTRTESVKNDHCFEEEVPSFEMKVTSSQFFSRRLLENKAKVRQSKIGQSIGDSEQMKQLRKMQVQNQMLLQKMQNGLQQEKVKPSNIKKQFGGQNAIKEYGHHKVLKKASSQSILPKLL